MFGSNVHPPEKLGSSCPTFQGLSRSLEPPQIDQVSMNIFYSKTGFWPSYCQISTDNLDKILHTPVVVWNTLVGRLRPRSAHGRLQAKPKRLCFCNTCNAPYVLYRDDGSPRFRQQTARVEIRTGAIVKNSGIL